MAEKPKRPTQMSAAQLGDILAEQRKTLADKVGAIPEEVLVEFGSANIGDLGRHAPEGHFSDWPDTFTNNGTWYKTWGKAGGDIAAPVSRDQIRPADVVGAISAVRQGVKKT